MFTVGEDCGSPEKTNRGIINGINYYIKQTNSK